ncbi:MAG TPA: ROK family protein, partial [Roseiflexaceae bacterium]|nr:ROK family protein [Roseiflexaceae bacterium]
WEDLPLRDMLRARYRLPVYLGNDAHMAALAEYTFGSSQRRKNLAVIRAGQGIGAGLILNGRLFYGSGHGAGEIGHIVVAEGGRACKCGNSGCLETVAGSQAIVRQAQALAAAGRAALLRQLAAGPDAIDFEAVVAACRAGDTDIQALVADVGRYLAIAIAGLIGILNVERIVITGPLARFGDALREAVLGELPGRVLPALTQMAEVAVVEEHDDAMLLGIAALLLNYELVLQRDVMAAYV